jgi:hypothetical protein
MKLNRSQLRKIILQEIQSSIDEEIIFAKDGYLNYGMQSQHDQGHAYRSKCSECGSKMYEGDNVCEQCGYSMTEEETRKEYINAGACGGCGTCNACGPVDHDLDDDFIPDHMTPQGGHDFDQMQAAMFNRFPHIKNIDVEFDHDDDVKIGNHKHYKGSYMAKSHLYKVNKYAEKLYHMIPDGHNLEDWMRTKLAQIADDIGEVYHALDHDIYEGDV